MCVIYHETIVTNEQGKNKPNRGNRKIAERPMWKTNWTTGSTSPTPDQWGWYYYLIDSHDQVWRLLCETKMLDFYIEVRGRVQSCLKQNGIPGFWENAQVKSCMAVRLYLIDRRRSNLDYLLPKCTMPIRVYRDMWTQMCRDVYIYMNGGKYVCVYKYMCMIT